MTTLVHTTTDAVTMIGRNLTRAVRSGLVVYTVGIPLVVLVLFVYVFGATLGAGIVPGGDRQDYLAFVFPGILMLTIAGLMQIVAIAIAQDMTEGIVARFRSMSISRGAVHAGHVGAGVAQGVTALVLLTGLAVLMGLRSDAGLLDGVLAAGLLLLVLLALTWLAVAIGTFAKTVESASNLPMPFLLLPFLSAGFVPADSMPAWLRWFTGSQPFTPWIETLRGLLFGTEIGANGVLAVAWCLVLGATGYLWARRLYERKSLR